MTISSLIPERDPNLCPICRHDYRLGPSFNPRDEPCPACGYLLWFPNTQAGHIAVRDADYEELVMMMGKTRLGSFREELQPQFERATNKLLDNEWDFYTLITNLSSYASRAANWREFLHLIEGRKRAGLLRRFWWRVLDAVGPRYDCEAKVLVVASKPEPLP